MERYDNDDPKGLKHQTKLEKEEVTGVSRREANALKWTLDSAVGITPKADRERLNAVFAQKEKEARAKHKLDKIKRYGIERDTFAPRMHTPEVSPLSRQSPVLDPHESKPATLTHKPSRFNQAVSLLGVDSISDKVIDKSDFVTFDEHGVSKNLHKIQPVDVDLGVDFDGDLPKKDDGDKGLGE